MGDQNKYQQLCEALIKLKKFWIVFGLVLAVAGITCLYTQSNADSSNCQDSTKITYKEIASVKYSKCEQYDVPGRVCADYIENNPGMSCTCSLPVEVKEDINGDVVIMYRLDTFNESIHEKHANFFLSRDDDQLSGKLSARPSEACEPFAYNNGTPIAPCGALADYMFTDNILLYTAGDYLPFSEQFQSTGIILPKYKKEFHNPPGNLSLAFANFSKPESWSKNIWELDPKNPGNNGFENEAFIVWMTPELQSDFFAKPMKKLDRTNETYKNGLPKGKDYNFFIDYKYPTSAYDGERTAILAEATVEINQPCFIASPAIYNIGATLLVIGIIILIVGLITTAPDLLEKVKNVTQKKDSVNAKSEAPLATVEEISPDKTPKKEGENKLMNNGQEGHKPEAGDNEYL